MYTIRTLDNGKLVIGHVMHPGLAWSDEAHGWSPLWAITSSLAFPPIQFDTEEALEHYVNDNYLYPRRD